MTWLKAGSWLPKLSGKSQLSNLIGNAIKYHHRPSGRVEIQAIARSSCWQFTVIDDGPGIAPENHHKIFGIFQTLVGRNDPKGTGIGLAIVKKIVESRGGSVWVESELGQGSAFSFTWPALSQVLSITQKCVETLHNSSDNFERE